MSAGQHHHPIHEAHQQHHQTQSSPRRREYRSSDDDGEEDEQQEENGESAAGDGDIGVEDRKRGPATVETDFGQRRLVISYPKSPLSPDRRYQRVSDSPNGHTEGDMASTGDSEDEDEGHFAGRRHRHTSSSPEPSLPAHHCNGQQVLHHQQPPMHASSSHASGNQPRLSILNHTAGHQHPHIPSNHSHANATSSNGSGGSSNIHNHHHVHHHHHSSGAHTAPVSSSPSVSDMMRTSSGAHVIIGSPTHSANHTARTTDPMIFTKGENGSPLAYRVVPVSDLHYQQQQSQSGHHHHHSHHTNQSPGAHHHHSNSSNSSHMHSEPGIGVSSSHHAATILAGLSGGPAIITSAGNPAVHYHHPVTGLSGSCNGHGGSPGPQPVASSGAGGYYVMMSSSPPDHLPVHGSPASRKQKSNSINVADLSCSGGGGGRNSRDEKRRATHNEVERRRRDKINNWITKLAKLVPDCNQDHTKQGQSKGGILAKTCDHICDLEQRGYPIPGLGEGSRNPGDGSARTEGSVGFNQQ